MITYIVRLGMVKWDQIDDILGDNGGEKPIGDSLCTATVTNERVTILTFKDTIHYHSQL